MQNIDWIFNPVMFHIGPLTARWYGFMYALAFIFGYLYLHYSKAGKKTGISSTEKDSLSIWTIAGVILGGRIGYIVFYNASYYLHNPIKIFSVWEGGMSFHGGALGVTIALLIFSKLHKINFWRLSDIIITIVPVGVMLVRIGNFINGELVGRIANKFCLYFPSDPQNCRYPSQLFQALLEGFILFLILHHLNGKIKTPGILSGIFLVLYGIFRIFAEKFREPDPQIGYLYNLFTMGQILSSIMIFAGTVLVIYFKKRAKRKIPAKK